MKGSEMSRADAGERFTQSQLLIVALVTLVIFSGLVYARVDNAKKEKENARHNASIESALFTLRYKSLPKNMPQWVMDNLITIESGSGNSRVMVWGRTYGEESLYWVGYITHSKNDPLPVVLLENNKPDASSTKIEFEWGQNERERYCVRPFSDKCLFPRFFEEKLSGERSHGPFKIEGELP